MDLFGAPPEMAMPMAPPGEVGGGIPDLLALPLPGDVNFDPAYPAWLFKNKDGQRVLIPPKRPGASAMTSWAKSDQMLYGLLLMRFARDLAMYRQDNTAVFDIIDPTAHEAMVSIEPTIQTNKLCNMIGSMPSRVSWPFKTEAERDAAQAAEDWATWFLLQWDRQHRSQGNGPLQWEMGFSAALYGRIVARVLPDPDDPDFPWKPELIDPATCFPVFGDKYGLLRMSRVYGDTLGRVIDGFDATGERGLHKKFTKHYKASDDGDTQLDYDRDGEVIDVYTRWHRYVSFDGVQILHEAHEYGRVPYIYVLMTGEMGLTSTPSSDTSNPYQLTSSDIRQGRLGEFDARQVDIARKGLSFFDAFRQAIRYEEMLYGLLMTLVKLDANPPMITTSAVDEVSKVDLRPGGHTLRRPGQTTDPITLQSRANVVGPLATLLAQARTKAGLPDVMFGASDGSNVTGFAEATLLAAAKDRTAPYVEAVEFAKAETLEMAAYLFHGFGHLYVEDAATGMLRVPKRGRDPFGLTKNLASMPPFGQMMASGATPMDVIGMQQAGMGMAPPDAPEDEPEVSISRETFDLVGFRPKVILEAFDWYQMTQKANVAQMLTQGRIWSEWTARDKLGVEDPSREGRWIDAETARKFPPLLEGVIYPRALWETGDIDGFLAYLAARQAQNAAPAGGVPGGMPPGMPSIPGMGGTPPGIQTVQGDSQPLMGPEGTPGRPRNQEPGLGGM